MVNNNEYVHTENYITHRGLVKISNEIKIEDVTSVLHMKSN